MNLRQKKKLRKKHAWWKPHKIYEDKSKKLVVYYDEFIGGKL